MNKKLKVQPKNVVVPNKDIVYHYRLNKNKIDVDQQIRQKQTKRLPTSNKKINKPRLNTRRRANRRANRSINNIDYKEKINELRDCGLNKTLCIFAPGPSILESNIERLKGFESIDTMTINKPDRRFWPTTYWLFCDQSQYKRNEASWNNYNGMVINSSSIRSTHKNQIKIKNMSGKGFSRDLNEGFYIGRSSTYAAMQVALWMNYDKIFIFGCDMCRVDIEVDGKKKSILHSYGTNPDVPERVREKRFKNESEFYYNAAKILNKDISGKFYFCSSYNPWPFVNLFNRLDQKLAVDVILESKNG